MIYVPDVVVISSGRTVKRDFVTGVMMPIIKDIRFGHFYRVNCQNEDHDVIIVPIEESNIELIAESWMIEISDIETLTGWFGRYAVEDEHGSYDDYTKWYGPYKTQEETITAINNYYTDEPESIF